MMKINKARLVDNIYKRLDGATSKLVIRDVIAVICNYVIEEMEHDRTVSIQNFGTFSPYRFHEHDGVDVSSGAMRHVEGFRSVKFLPHAIFRLLLNRKRKKFKKNLRKIDSLDGARKKIERE